MSKRRRKKSFKRLLKHKLLRKRNFISLTTIILSITLFAFLINLNILPFKHMLIIFLIFIMIITVGTILINVHRKNYLKTVGVIVLLLVVICSCIGLYYVKITNLFFNEAFDTKNAYIKSTYYVLSKKSNNFKESDILDEIVTYKETINLTEALNRLNDKFSLKEKQYDNIETIFNNLNNNIDKFVLIDKTSYEIIFLISKIYNKADYEILYEYDVYTKRKSNIDQEKDKFNIYVGGINGLGLIDFNLIISVNIKTNEILLTGIPNNYYIEVVGKEYQYDKLSYLNAYGINTSKDSLEKLLDIQIDYTLLVDNTNFIKIVDYIDGINYCSNKSFTTTQDIVSDSYTNNGKKLHIDKGCQHLDGAEALTIIQERNIFKRDERLKNCKKIVSSVVEKVLSLKSLINYNEITTLIKDSFETDINDKIIRNIIKDTLSNGNNWKIITQTLDGQENVAKVYLSNLEDIVTYPDYNSVTLANKKIKETLK